MNIKYLVAAVIFAFAANRAHAEFSGNVIRIGVLTDMSGVFADIEGPGSVVAAKLAADDFGNKIGSTPIEIISADHQNKAEIGSAIARKWLDSDGVDMITDLTNSSVALAVAEILKQKNKVGMITGSLTTRLTGDSCSPNHVQYSFDTFALANATSRLILKGGGDTWFFITADYAFGHDMEAQAGKIILANGGKILGSAKHPLGSSDFSSYLLQAQASGAKVIGLANSTSDFINAIKQGREFGMTGKQEFAGLTVYLTDIDALGLEAAQGTVLSIPFYWNLNDQTRAFSQRFFDKHGKMPTAFQAAVYASVLHYLKTVSVLQSDEDGRAVVAKMKEIPTDDPVYGKGSIRIDGRKLHPLYLFQVKTPQESKGRWDYYKLVQTIPVEDAWKPLDPACSLVAKQ